jgi:hypothetical protein
MKAAFMISAIMAVTAAATPLQAAKRQLAPPPPDCGDEDAFALCAAVNSIVCFNPLPLAIAEWSVH